jgi:hypothetical protein
VQYLLQFNPPPAAPPTVVALETRPPADGPKVVSLSEFRKK